MKSLDKLGIDDDAFLVSSLIDRCPRVMMLRELFQNAVEAAQLSTGKRLIRIGAAEVDGVRKLRIWNTGPGMDPDALFRMGEISSSINKEKALDRNFGIGAKVACLPSNHLGVRYRSCANGRDNEMILGKRGGVYGRLLLRSPGRGSETSVSAIRDVIDVTDIAVAEGQPLTEDWTEAVLLGMRPDQDTVLDPYDGKPAVERYWIPETLYHRYARIPGDLQVIINEPLHWAVGERPFVPILARALNEFAGYEAVRSPEGVTVHFLHDPAHPQRRWENASSEDAIQTSMTFVAVMWRNEFYDLRSGSPWYYEAPMFGVTHGGRHVSVIVELPDDYEVLPDMYRQYLLYNAERQDQVRVAEFAGLVRRVRPSWIQGIVQPQDSGGAGVEMLVPELSTLAAALRLDELPIVSRDAAETDATESEPGDAFEKASDLCKVTAGVRRRTSAASRPTGHSGSLA
ncbi:MAG: ATP-binding protein [Rhodospirillales bacterium]|nr:ATP-binding protein [Rhodospirillales bacterium]